MVRVEALGDIVAGRANLVNLMCKLTTVNTVMAEIKGHRFCEPACPPVQYIQQSRVHLLIIPTP